MNIVSVGIEKYNNSCSGGKSFIVKCFSKEECHWPSGQKLKQDSLKKYHIEMLLSAQLKGVDVVISMMGNNYEHQKLIINACVEAQIPRFVTWEYGVDLHSIDDSDYSSDSEPINITTFLDNTPSSFKYTLFHTGFLQTEILSNNMGFHFKDKIITFYGSGEEPFNITFKHDLLRILVYSAVEDKLDLYRRKIVIGKRTSQRQIYDELKKEIGTPIKVYKFRFSEIPENQRLQRLLAIGGLKAFVGKNEIHQYFPGFDVSTLRNWFDKFADDGMNNKCCPVKPGHNFIKENGSK
ncbi:3995_t:CDS:2, partial [Acaulospora morrowiae]